MNDDITDVVDKAEQDALDAATAQLKAEIKQKELDFMACFDYSPDDFVAHIAISSCPLGPVLNVECVVIHSKKQEHEFRKDHPAMVLIESWSNSRIQDGDTVQDTDDWAKSNQLTRLVAPEELVKVKEFQAKWNIGDDGNTLPPADDLPKATTSAPTTLQ